MCDRGLVGVSIGVRVCDKGKKRESMSTQRLQKQCTLKLLAEIMKCTKAS